MVRHLLASILIGMSFCLVPSNMSAQSQQCIDTGVIGDGWGWNGTASCRLATTSANTAGSCADTGVIGDGWGWNGVASCRIGQNSSTQSTTAASSNTSTQSTPASSNTSSTNCIDTGVIGDGWGWNGTASCRIPRTTVSATSNTSTNSSSACIDTGVIGDGWGWNGTASCRIGVNNQPTNNQPTNNNICSRIDSSRSINELVSVVTDVVLTAGQSNAAGNNTDYNPNIFQDRGNIRMLVWTNNNRWEIADPRTQRWHGSLPFPNNYNGVFNHPGFQISRALTNQDQCRVVALIATSAPGQRIDYWLNETDGHYRYLTNKVYNALNALGRDRVDLLWWMQGESDDNANHGQYFNQLNRLIAKFRREGFFDYNGYFIANQTRDSYNANAAISWLDSDNDSKTLTSIGQGLPFIRSEYPETVHFNADALRTIGDAVANLYLSRVGRNN